MLQIQLTKSANKAVVILCLILATSVTLNSANAQNVCTGFTTYGQGAWGATGTALTTYLNTNFNAVFPSGLTMGYTGKNTLKLTSAQAVLDFLPSSGTPAVLPSGTTTNPGSSYSNAFAGQLAAAMLNVGFDNYDANFSSNSQPLGTTVMSTGTFKNWTVNAVILEANNTIGGFSSTYSASTLTTALNSINSNYNNGNQNNGDLWCTTTCTLSITAVVTNATCNGSTNGAIDVTSSGVVGSVSYSWGSNITTEDRSNIAAGTYSVTATDYSGCTSTKSYTVTQPTAVSVSSVITNVKCNGNQTGAINITATGGNTGYTYLWNDNVTTEDRSNIKSGTYSVKVTDSKGCTNNSSFTVTQPNSALTASGYVQNVTVKNGNDGSISVKATGGTTLYSYLWSDGSTNKDRSGLTAGNYTLTVTDANACKTNNLFTVTQPANFGTSASSNIQNASAKNMSATVSMQAAVSPNPAKGMARLTINAQAAANATVTLYNMSGVQVIKTTMSLNAGANTKQIDLSTVAPGTYQLMIVSGTEKETIKMIVQ